MRVRPIVLVSSWMCGVVVGGCAENGADAPLLEDTGAPAIGAPDTTTPDTSWSADASDASAPADVRFAPGVSCSRLGGAPAATVSPGTRRCREGRLEEETSPGAWTDRGSCAAADACFGDVALRPVIHWDGVGRGRGSACLPVSGPLITGTSADDVWLTGWSPSEKIGSLWHWDGATWLEVGRPIAMASVLQLDRCGGVWVGGLASSSGSFTTRLLRWDGKQWTDRTPIAASGKPLGSTALREALDGTLWLGTTEDVRQHDGARWTRVPGEGASVVSLFASGPFDAWIADSYGKLRHVDERGVQAPYAPGGGVSSEGFSTLVGFARDDVWSDGRRRWDGSAWRATDGVALDGRVSGYLRDGSTGLLALVVSGGCMRPLVVSCQLWDGASWTTDEGRLARALPQGPYGSWWGTSGKNVWIVPQLPWGGC